MPYIMNNGINIHYQIEGSGPPLILLHGLFGSIENWYAFGYVEELKKEYKLILIDLRGHGQSDKPHESNNYSYTAFVEDVIAVLDGTGEESAHVFGHSMGGWFIYGLVQRFPERIRSIIMSDGVPGRIDPGFISSIVESFDEWVSGLKDIPASGKEQLLKNDLKALTAISDWVDKDAQVVIELIDGAIENINMK